MTNLADGSVYELDEHGSRLLYAAGSPEAEAFHATYGDIEHPVDLEPATPPDDDELDPDVPNDPVPEPAEPEPEDDAETSPEPPEGEPT